MWKVFAYQQQLDNNHKNLTCTISVVFILTIIKLGERQYSHEVMLNLYNDIRVLGLGHFLSSFCCSFCKTD